jgi:3-oxoadipate enol-lactonase
VKIAWDATGAGAPVLLVQGLGYPRWGWDPIVTGLAERYRVVRFDNRGIGESDKPPGPYSADDMALDALQVLDEAGVERAHVIGASLGGMIAQCLAFAHPERVDRLVLCCTTPGGEDAVPMPEVTTRLFAEAAELDPAVALRRFVENALGSTPPEGLVDELFARRVASPPDPEGWQSQAAAGLTFQGVELERIGAPTLVLHGTEDNVVDRRNADLLAERIPDARARLLPGTGHMFFWEQPGESVRLIAEVLE